MLKQLPKKVRIVEVGPRDGLQNEKSIVSIDDKVTFIKMLADSGLNEIEATSFVRAEKIPQMSDGGELNARLQALPELKNTRLISLVPNMKGMEGALKAGVRDIAVFTATSNTFNQKNINATIDESLQRIEEVMKVAVENKIRTRGYISTVLVVLMRAKPRLMNWCALPTGCRISVFTRFLSAILSESPTPGRSLK